MEEAETLRRRGRAGHYGITAEEEEAMKRRKRAFTRTTLSAIKSQLKIVSQSYQDMVRTFLLQLAEVSLKARSSVWWKRLSLPAGSEKKLSTVVLSMFSLTKSRPLMALVSLQTCGSRSLVIKPTALLRESFI